MPSKARLAIIGVLGLSLASCSQATQLVIFNATDHPLKLGRGADAEVIPARGFISTRAYLSAELQNHEGGIADVDLDRLPMGKSAEGSGVTSVVIDEQTPFFKRRRP